MYFFVIEYGTYVFCSRLQCNEYSNTSKLRQLLQVTFLFCLMWYLHTHVCRTKFVFIFLKHILRQYRVFFGWCTKYMNEVWPGDNLLLVYKEKCQVLEALFKTSGTIFDVIRVVVFLRRIHIVCNVFWLQVL